MKLNSTSLDWRQIMRYCGHDWCTVGFLEHLTVNLQGTILVHRDVVLLSEANWYRRHFETSGSLNFPKEQNFNIDTLEISHFATYKAGFFQIRHFSNFAEDIVLSVMFLSLRSAFWNLRSSLTNKCTIY